MHLNALYSPNQKKKTILETVKIATEDGYYFKRLILCENWAGLITKTIGLGG